MSHVVSGTSKCTNKSIIKAACTRLGLEAPTEGNHQLYSGTVTGTAVRLPNWKFPAVYDTETGGVRYDNYGGAWGDAKELDRFHQAYAVEKHAQVARAQGYGFQEVQQDDGTIQMKVLVEA